MSTSSVSDSSGSTKKKHAVSASTEAGTTKDGGEDDGPQSSEHKRIRLEYINDDDEDDRKPSADPQKCLADALTGKAGALADIQAAQQKLQDFKAKEEAARRDIRAGGEVEFDSLLVVGNDSIMHILGYFDVKALCRCEMVCKAFHRLSAEGWKDLDKRAGPNKSIVDSPKQRCVRYASASEYALLMEDLAGDHNFYEYIDLQGDIGIFRREAGTNAVDPSVMNDIRDYRYCKRLKEHMVRNGSNVNCTCDFPERLTEAHRSLKEVFLRIAGPTEGSVLFEGFCSLKFGRDSCPFVDLRGVSHAKWPLMERLLSSGEEVLEKAARIKETLQSIRSVTIVSLSSRNEPQLLFANVDSDRPVVKTDARNMYSFIERDGRSDCWCARLTAPLYPHSEIENKFRVPCIDVQFLFDDDEGTTGFRILRQHFDLSRYWELE